MLFWCKISDDACKTMNQAWTDQQDSMWTELIHGNRHHIIFSCAIIWFQSHTRSTGIIVSISQNQCWIQTVSSGGISVNPGGGGGIIVFRRIAFLTIENAKSQIFWGRVMSFRATPLNSTLHRITLDEADGCSIIFT